MAGTGHQIRADASAFSSTIHGTRKVSSRRVATRGPPPRAARPAVRDATVGAAAKTAILTGRDWREPRNEPQLRPLKQSQSLGSRLRLGPVGQTEAIKPRDETVARGRCRLHALEARDERIGIGEAQRRIVL